jgi:hypothetical protein
MPPLGSFWANVRPDIGRFREEGPGLCPVVRGILSQGSQALFVHRVFRWCYERGIPTQPFRFMVERFTEIRGYAVRLSRSRAGRAMDRPLHLRARLRVSMLRPRSWRSRSRTQKAARPQAM